MGGERRTDDDQDDGDKRPEKSGRRSEKKPQPRTHKSESRRSHKSKKGSSKPRGSDKTKQGSRRKQGATRDTEDKQVQERSRDRPRLNTPSKKRKAKSDINATVEKEVTHEENENHDDQKVLVSAAQPDEHSDPLQPKSAPKTCPKIAPGLKEKEKKDKEKKEKRKKLLPGLVVSAGDTRTYEVICLLGSGGFGEVYLVEGASRKRFAMKTERKTDNKQLERLKYEIELMDNCNTAKERKHFIKYRDKGETETFHFYVMDLIGQSLDDIRRKILCTNFSKSTALQISIQTLAAIDHLHTIGIIHRDIKVQNFAVGPNERQSVIYMLDLGIAKRYLDDAGKHIQPLPPGKKARFIGTLRWAARALHRGEEQSRKDDLETWLYMIIDVFDDGALPWTWVKERERFLPAKEMLMNEMVPEVYKNVPSSISKIVTYIRGMEFDEQPDYVAIKKWLLLMTFSDPSIDLTEPMDWIGCVKPVRMEGLGEDCPEEGTQVDSFECEDRRAFIPSKYRPLKRKEKPTAEEQKKYDADFEKNILQPARELEKRLKKEKNGGDDAKDDKKDEDAGKPKKGSSRKHNKDKDKTQEQQYATFTVKGPDGEGEENKENATTRRKKMTVEE